MTDLAKVENDNGGVFYCCLCATSDYHRVVKALKTYAAVQPLNLLKPGQIQDDLRAIAGERHTHRRCLGSDRCLICRRDLRDPIHREK